jgi:hypothetical protein
MRQIFCLRFEKKYEGRERPAYQLAVRTDAVRRSERRRGCDGAPPFATVARGGAGAAYVRLLGDLFGGWAGVRCEPETWCKMQYVTSAEIIAH